ncbi:DNA primase, UL52/UL70 type, Herpesviridae [Cynara cardunculus var. scolymus]|uniref:DNA-directed primase/polymerase protein n=1 Tax=Cynara cardunculus var. scolymus TaxID=59895 RepID=A0A103YDM1_CYNCS|nr:DNA primase, UL52/UL70 type, Herpesviridae [Cynara cardunculus var. scolymus]
MLYWLFWWYTYRQDVWATFPRQDEAMKYAKDYVGVRIFSYQDHASGQRRFLVSTYKEFWRRYKNMNAKFRHHYEVIEEGLPCHLYFDLEFNIRENAERNGDEMVDLLILITFEALLEKYAIEGDTNWVVELDSSTKDKFSRHLIIRLPGIAFKDNIHVGAFVNEICLRIHSARGRDKRFDQLFISKDSSSADVPCQLFVDTAVYSRNRCFRLHLSSKAGKSSVLLPTGRFKCKEMRNSTFCKPSTREFVPDACTHSGYLSGKSPFPRLDEFVEYVATIGNVQGCSSYKYGLMVYSMSRNRFCERIGRQHKSNHVMYVVDLQKAAYYQKCYDPDCRGYRSPLRPVPPEVFPDSSNQNESQELILPDGDENSMDSCQKDELWREAMLVADKVENMPRMLDLGKEDQVWDEDDEWWMAVESTASQIELAYCGHA